MTTGGVDSSSDRSSGVGGPSGPSGPDRSADVDADAKAELSATADGVKDTDADRVADEVVGDVDAVELADGAGPTGGPAAVDPEADVDAATAVGAFEPNPANRAAADAFNEELRAIETNTHLGFDNQGVQVLGKITEHAHGIEDLAERDKFVRAVAVDAGRAAGMYAKQAPWDAYNRLDELGKGTHPDTGRLLANSAVSTGPGADNLPVWGKEGSPVGDALKEINEGRARRASEVVSGVARAVLPGVDATVRAVEGDYEGAAASLGVDLAGGVLAKGGKLAWGAVAGAAAMAPGEAQAGVASRLTMKWGDEAVEFTAREALVKGRWKAFDIEVPGTFADGQTGTLRLYDSRAKHNKLATRYADADLDSVAKTANGRRSPNDLAVLKGNKPEAQFTGRFNTPHGQAELAKLVMERVGKADLDAIGMNGAIDVRMPMPIGLTTTRNGTVVSANSVTIMRNNDGGFHLVPMP